MVGWHHQLNGYEFEQSPGIGDGQGSLECCSPWGHKELDTTEQLNPLATWCEQLSHWKRPWCWERLKEGGEEDDRGWDDWMASPTQWTWVWATPRNSEGQGSPTMLQSMSWTWLNNWTTTIIQFRTFHHSNLSTFSYLTLPLRELLNKQILLFSNTFRTLILNLYSKNSNWRVGEREKGKETKGENFFYHCISLSVNISNP